MAIQVADTRIKAPRSTASRPTSLRRGGRLQAPGATICAQSSAHGAFYLGRGPVLRAGRSVQITPELVSGQCGLKLVSCDGRADGQIALHLLVFRSPQTRTFQGRMTFRTRQQAARGVSADITNPGGKVLALTRLARILVLDEFGEGRRPHVRTCVGAFQTDNPDLRRPDGIWIAGSFKTNAAGIRWVRTKRHREGQRVKVPMNRAQHDENRRLGWAVNKALAGGSRLSSGRS